MTVSNGTAYNYGLSLEAQMNAGINMSGITNTPPQFTEK